VTGRDREFLPAALEILETPPPPLPIALIMTICIFALAALIWSCVGRLDVHAVASGKIETAGYSKVIEPLDPGKVAAIHVEAGQSVKAGDLLVELEPAEPPRTPSQGRTRLAPVSPRSRVAALPSTRCEARKRWRRIRAAIGTTPRR
jgi:hemolysin D